MRMQKLKYLIVVALLIAVCWLGYWIGYISSKPSQIEELVHLQNVDENINQIIEENEKHYIDKDNNHIILLKDNPGSESKLNVNRKKSSFDHVLGIHKSHAAQISQHINKEKTKEDHTKSAVSNTEVHKNVIHGVKQLNIHGNQKMEGVEWKHLNSEKMDAKPASEDSPAHDFDQQYYVLMHSGKATKVHGQIHEKLPSLPESVPPESYIFEELSLPTNPRLRPSIANGHIGTVVHGHSVFMNGLYNGHGTDSHRAAIPSTCSLNITDTEPETKFTRTYKLNVGEGIYSEVSKSKDYTLTQRIYAHRSLTRLLVVEIDLVRTDVSHPLRLQVKLNKWTSSYDISFTSEESGISEVSYKKGRINTPETEKSGYQNVHVVYDHVPDTLAAQKGVARIKWVFLTAIAGSNKEAFDAYLEGSALIKNNDDLYAKHVRAWADVWQRSRIDIIGDLKTAKATYGAWYNILAAMPVEKSTTMEFVGLSPTGLSYGDNNEDDYWGHVFWDQETWMYPPVLLFRPDLAKTLLYTRKRTMQGAQENAKLNDHTGLQYPWESARSGLETTPCPNCSKYQQHISGDISYSILQYLYATHDSDLIQYEGFAEIITGIANFWVGRLFHNSKTDLYEIHCVMPPDEHAICINNSVYTNYIAQISLSAPEYIFMLLNKTETHWKHFANSIYIPFDEKKHYHPEYDGYKYGTKVKQADVILLGYPLLKSMPVEVRRNDLEIYEKVTNVSGPAMSWPMFTIGWLELGEVEKAHTSFMKNFKYIHTDFQIWAEVQAGVDKGATNFITGMGGFLQSLIFGYGGVRLRPNQLDLHPVLPSGAREAHYIGLTYMGNVFDMFVYADGGVMINVKERKEKVLHLYLYASEELHDLNVNVPVRVKSQRMCVLLEGLQPQ